LPWTADGESFGFGPGPATPPQPAWFADYAVAVQEATSGSTLRLYREALALRPALLTGTGFDWVADAPDVLHFARPAGWHCIANFGGDPAPLPPGELLVSSLPLVDGRLAPDSTAWLRITS
jgi:alpha-glucosidase